MKRLVAFSVLFIVVFFATKYGLENSHHGGFSEQELAASNGMEGDYTSYLEGAKTDLVVYTVATCEACNQLKRFLNDSNIEYTEFDAANDLIVKSNMQTLGVAKVPVIITKNKLFVGFSDHIKAHLNKG